MNDNDSRDLDQRIKLLWQGELSMVQEATLELAVEDDPERAREVALCRYLREHPQLFAEAARAPEAHTDRTRQIPSALPFPGAAEPHRRVARWAMVASLFVSILGNVFLLLYGTLRGAAPTEAQLMEASFEARLEYANFSNSYVLRTSKMSEMPENDDQSKGLSALAEVQLPQEIGGGVLELRGYRQNDRNPLQSRIVAFRPFDPIVPVWESLLQDDEVPADLVARPDRDYSGLTFGVKFFELFDVFPERPGDEIVAVFQHGPYSQCVVRVIGLDGELLYQAWHDGNVTSLWWMHEAGVLVCGAVNGEVLAEQRQGMPEIKGFHPRVVFGIRPRIGQTEPLWVRTVDHSGGVNPVFYRCLRGGKLLNKVRDSNALRPMPGLDSGRHVLLSLQLETEEGIAEIGIALDAEGNEFGGRIVTDSYRRCQRKGELPDPAQLSWDDLPPIKPGEEVDWLPGANDAASQQHGKTETNGDSA